MREILAVLDRWYAARLPFGLATVVSVGHSAPRGPGAALAVGPDGEVVGSMAGGCVEGAVFELAQEVVETGTARLETFGCTDDDAFASGLTCGGEITVLVRLVTPARDPVFGAIDHAAAVARLGGFLGYRVTVCDARPVFATPSRFPEGVEVVVDWPHRYLRGTRTDERTVICVLTHDPKFDVPVLREALRRPAAYIGAMGSRRTHDDRLRRLVESGLGDAELARLRSPVGLDLGARTPEEVAVSVAAEIVALRRGGTGAPLSRTSGAIHPRGVA
ncbi:XdhC family protein [Streptomyces sp. NPDC013455]|uniref:XdhC family protein n=1 Tax=Streptomyces sp. NPDC013455 TaxID=3155605 RepID=UPI0033F9D329